MSKKNKLQSLISATRDLLVEKLQEEQWCNAKQVGEILEKLLNFTKVHSRAIITNIRE